jgi:hypothetical protein
MSATVALYLTLNSGSEKANLMMVKTAIASNGKPRLNKITPAGSILAYPRH